jgi:hypothetical protein
MKALSSRSNKQTAAGVKEERARSAVKPKRAASKAGLQKTVS